MTHIYKGVCILLCMLTVTGRVAGRATRAAAVRLGGSVTDEQGRPVVGANIVAYDAGRKPHGTVAAGPTPRAALSSTVRPGLRSSVSACWATASGW